MSLACRRKCTVETDSAYSLMGLLEVRFPTYSAEGLPKAISRLLDEVIVAHNDLSVFNWSGLRQGSPVRGRSLYPSSLEAYGHPGSRGPAGKSSNNKNKELAEKVQIKMREAMAAYHNNLPHAPRGHRVHQAAGGGAPTRRMGPWCARLVEIAHFTPLRGELTNIGKILKFIQEHCGSAKPATTGPAADVAIKGQKGGSYFSSIPSISSIPSLPSIPSGIRPSLSAASSFAKDNLRASMPSLPSLSSKRSSTSQDSAPSAKKGIMGMRPAFGGGFGRKDSTSSPKALP